MQIAVHAGETRTVKLVPLKLVKSELDVPIHSICFIVLVTSQLLKGGFECLNRKSCMQSKSLTN